MSMAPGSYELRVSNAANTEPLCARLLRPDSADAEWLNLIKVSRCVKQSKPPLGDQEDKQCASPSA